MEASEFPQRLYTKGSEPLPDKSISYYAALREDEWAEIYESLLGVFLKFHNLNIGWGSRLVHHMLTFQIVCNQRYEIWSLIGTTPVRFSLHDFEEITGLNCGYLSNDIRVFWKRMGVDVALGPSTLEIIEACSNCSSWSRDDRLCLRYLGIYAGFIVATKPSHLKKTNHARLVVDLKVYKEFPWGRIAFQHLIKSVKEKDLSKYIHIERFVQALQVWVYYALPDFAAEFGEPLSNDPTPLLLAYKGSRGRKNVKANMLKHTNSEKEDVPKQDNVNIGASESVNAPGSAKGKQHKEEDPETSLVEVDPAMCDVDFDGILIEKNSKARATTQIVVRAKSARNCQLAASQKSHFEGNSTAKTIIPTVPRYQGLGYDTFDQTGVRQGHTILMNYVKLDLHMEVCINLLRLRLTKHPEWFWSDRICFLNSIFATVWRHFLKSDSNEDGSGRLQPPRAFSYYTRELPIYCVTNKMWTCEVDHLYSMLHIRRGPLGSHRDFIFGQAYHDMG
ncbi:hypothetical protein EUTSA_v10023844mg [Eutrema salsugineum]|uniref:DUF1985 domain-containing protein n=1 Tax=Eutrema salsugineum TaxID=72664 RepID=V4KEV5_EUTSA|nr:hypothetical protein EUTSA_v10023844mg [Eutrema salsugineum]